MKIQNGTYWPLLVKLLTGYKTNVGGADTVFPFRSITESSFSLLSQKYISAATHS